MSVVSLLNVTVNNNPASFGDPYEFEITFECLENLSKGMCFKRQSVTQQADFEQDLEWKLTYVGSATS